MQAVETLVPKTAFRLRRLDMRVVIGVILMLFAIAGTASVVQKARDRVTVLVAARSVEAGEVIRSTDLKVVDISVSREISYLAASRTGEVEGQVAAKPLAAGELLTSRSVASKASLPAGYVAMSIAIKPSRAAAGSLRGGDHVAVISSPSPERNESSTILFTDVVVQSVRQAQTSEGSAIVVALRLRLDEARALAEAQTRGAIDIVLLSRQAESKP